MMEKTCVSIVMPAYNAAEVLENTVRSVQAQTFGNWELIVVNDCSKDGTLALLERLAGEDSRIRYFTNEVNSGAAASRNVGLDHCAGTYIAFLDSDDRWHPEKLEKQVSRMEETGADIGYTSYSIVDGQGNKRCPDYIVPESVSFEDMLKQNIIGCSTVMLRAETLGGNRFSLDFYHEDYVLWLQLLRTGCKAVGLEQVLTEYCFHEDSRAGNKGNAAKERWKIYRNFLRFPVVKSLWYFGHYALAGVLKYRQL